MHTVLVALNTALLNALASDERVYVLGEDVLDPYGGAFKVTRGLSTAFPERVLTTPISEAGMVGVATGMALRGLRPVVEIMFGDFVTLIADQLINHIAKFRYMYNNQVRIPLIIRTPMGGRRGYGPTHSQTLEKIFLGIPGLRVLAPCNLGDPGALLKNAVLTTDDPVLFIENKLLYTLSVQGISDLSDFSLTLVSRLSPQHGKDSEESEKLFAPTYTLTIRGAPPPVLTIAAYGYMAELARQAVLQLAYEDEIFAEMVIPTQLAPYEIAPIVDSTQRTHKLLVIEEGNYTLGWGAEILARTMEYNGTNLHIAKRLAAVDEPIPASMSLESTVLPGIKEIIQAARKMV